MTENVAFYYFVFAFVVFLKAQDNHNIGQAVLH